MSLNSTLSEDFLNSLTMLSCTERLRRSKSLDCVKLSYTVNTCTASLLCGLSCEYLGNQTDWISCCICNIRTVSLSSGLFSAQQGYASFWIVCYKQYSVFPWAIIKDCFVVNRLSHTVHKYGFGLSSCECSVWSLLASSVFTLHELSHAQHKAVLHVESCIWQNQLNSFSRTWHLYALSPLWILPYSTKWDDAMNGLRQYVH